VRHVALVLVIACGVTTSCRQQASSEGSDALTSAFHDYEGLLDQAEHRIRGSQFFDSPENRAEGYRYLMGLISLQSKVYGFFADPDHPRFYCTGATPEHYSMFSNADNLYLSATISEENADVISGTLGTARQTIFGTCTGDTIDAKAAARIDGKDLKTDLSRYFELTVGGAAPVGKAPHLGNYLPMGKGVRTVTIYQIFSDWEHERKSTLSIRCSSYPVKAAPLETFARVARRMAVAGTAVGHILDSWLSVASKQWQRPVNVLGPARKLQLTSLGSWFVDGHYKIKPEDALVITIKVPADARYWGWTTYNLWSETLDYTTRQTSLNDSQAAADADGGVRLVIAVTDPGVQNWLDVSGHEEGFVIWRVLSESAPREMTAKVVRLAELKEYLPKSTNWVSPEQHAAALLNREAAVALRYSE